MKHLEYLRGQEKLHETKSVLSVITHQMVIPLFLLFWVCDYFYYPLYKWEFLGIRLLVIPLSLTTRFYLRKMTRFFSAQVLAFFYITGLASIIHYLIFRIHDWGTSYYAGLNLVAIGSLSFIPWSWYFFSLAVMAIYLPYFLGIYLFSSPLTVPHLVMVNSFFILGTVIITLFLHFLSEQLRRKELKSRNKLQTEVELRGKIIEEKTQEALRLSELSRQFSPQVVEAIKQNYVQLTDEVHRARICALFVDIVNSTEKVIQIETNQVTKVINRFMYDCSRILLKYDITIDKFLGDGILAFSNDPVSYEDYVERVLRAAIEIKEKIHKDRLYYEENWAGLLEIKVGIDVGIAHTGFYGNSKYYHSYTAIGPVINLASRLCQSADPGQILVSQRIISYFDHQRKQTEFQFSFLATKAIKGFYPELMNIYEVSFVNQSTLSEVEAMDCPKCGKLMHIDTDQRRIFIFRCRHCGHSIDSIGA